MEKSVVIVMKPDAAERDTDYVIRRARSLGLETHASVQDGRTVVGITGDVQGLGPTALGGLRGVDCVRPMKQPFRLACRDFRSDPTTVRVRDVVVGGPEVVLIAGPCSVETRERLLRTARGVKAAGARLLRGGAFKPRSSPYSFQGLAERGLEILAEVREETGLPIVTEVLASEQVPLVARYADVLQIGTRNMHNYMLLHAVGETGLPVLLKRGMTSTLEELLLSAEYVLSHGNSNVILCERGIRTFETYTRNTLDINAVPALKELSHLPVIVDPSHATGRRSLVRAVGRAAVAAGADGLLIEVHHDPDGAWSDGTQTLPIEQFGDVAADAHAIARAIGRQSPARPLSATA
jgi:3-deoxy-7-phosphoheptulonate synthase